MTINYMIATHFGDRNGITGPHFSGIPSDHSFKTNRLYFIEQHFNALTTLKNHVDQITLIINKSSMDGILEEPLNKLIASYPQLNIKILRRDNNSFSYGAWDYGFTQFRDFDYYITLEDDYIPVIDNFDDKMIEMLESYDHCGFICQYFGNYPSPHATLSNGFCKGDAIRDILTKNLQLQYPTDDLYNTYANQMKYHEPFINAGWTVHDMIPWFGADCRNGPTFQRYGTKSENILKPL